MAWEIELYKDRSGKEPVAEFLDDLQVGTRAKVVKMFDRLVEYGVLLAEPFTRQIRGKVRELRVKDNQGNPNPLLHLHWKALYPSARLSKEDRQDA